MKRMKAMVCAALSVSMMVALLVSCDTGSSSKTTKDDPVVAATYTKGALADWQIALGYQNTSTLPLKIEAGSGTDAGTMKVTWSSSTDFRGCELYALLPTSMSDSTAADYGAFDGIQFDVKLPKSSNFLLLLRNPDGGTTWKIWEDYVYRGTDDSGDVWVTVKEPFSAAVDTGWGPASAQATLKEWATADKATQKQINLNPVLNVGGGGVGDVDTNIVMYVDNVGFYKAGATAAEDTFTPIWDFN